MHWPWKKDAVIPKKRDPDCDRRAEEAELHVRDLEKRASKLAKNGKRDVWSDTVRRIARGG